MPGNLSRLLLDVSLVGLALFVPFSIAGANVSIGLAGVGMLLSLLEEDSRRRLGGFLRDPIFRAALILAAVSLVSLFMSQDLQRAWKDWRSYYLFVIYVLAAFHLRGRRSRSRLLWALFFSATLSSLVALIQGFGGIRFWFIHIEGALRPSSTLYIMTFAGVMYQVILLFLALFLSSAVRGKRAALLGAGILLQNLALILNLTRGAWIALFAGAFFLAGTTRTRRAWLSLAFLAALYTAALLYNPAMRTRWLAISEDIKNPKLSSITTRVVLWDVSLEMIGDHPLFGVGLGDFSDEAEARLRGRTVRSTVDAHNIFLHVLATQGILGLVPFLFLWWSILRMLSSLGRRAAGDPESSTARGVLAAAIAVLVGGLTENNIYDSEVSMAFLLLLGVARSLLQENETRIRL